MPITVSFWMRIVPEVANWIVMMRTTPDQISRPASVTTKEGTPAFVITIACRNPMIVVTASATPIAAHAGQFEASGRRRRVIRTPPTALTNATERSISPIRRTNTIPIAIVATAAICSRRFVKFLGVKNVSSSSPNTRAITISPITIGIDPSSPPRIASHLRLR
jgi:hypothetical protein